MQKGDYIFVYGTLRRGEAMDLTKQFYNFGIDYCGSDIANGKLFHLGAYPGAKTEALDKFDETGPFITGEVFRIRDANVVALLDAYEGYDADSPTTGLYNRVQTRTSTGKLVWIYTYNYPVTSDQCIESGDWCKNREIPIRRRALG